MPKRLFALSDPHLSLSGAKPMDVFGPQWDNHAARIAENWRRAVGDDDIVLVPGDISWGMKIADAKPDLEWLAALPGEKVVVRGNHDYWWSSLAKLNALGLPKTHFIQNNHVRLGNIAVGGTRLWDFPGIYWPFAADPDSGNAAKLESLEDGKAVMRENAADTEKIRARELERLKLSLASLPRDATLKIALTHYPPLGEDGAPTAITELINGYGIDLCVFGHVHGPAPAGRARPGEDVVIDGTRYVLASSDILGHEPKLLCETSE